jgi:hypothetical protein
MTQSPTGYPPLPAPIPETATIQERLAHVAALRAQQDRRAAALARSVTDPDSLAEIIKRAEARRAEQARRDKEAHRMPPQAGPIRNETSLAPAQDGPGEDKESANLLGDEMGGPSVLSASSSEEPDALPTQTGPGQNAESIESLDAIQARLNAQTTRAAEDRMLSLRTGHRQDAETTARPTDERAAQSTPGVAPTPNEPKRFTGGLPNEESKAARTPLSDEVKQFIVKGLACYDTPSQVAEAATLMFGVSISRQRVYRYAPDNPRPPAQRWRDLHAATRQALLRELGEIGVAHRAVRLRRLDRLESRCERNNVTTALKCLEMAAKECGGIYENRRPIVLQVPVPQPPLPQPELSR